MNDLNEITGTREEVEEQLKSLADNNCKRCYGKGHTGFNLTHKIFRTCECVIRNYNDPQRRAVAKTERCAHA